MRSLRKHLSAVVIAAALMALTACGSNPAATTSAATTGGATTAATLTKVTVGASPVPHAKILEYVSKNLAAKAGIELKIVEFDDYVQPNEALAGGELDANYFQHLPYLEDQIKSKGYKFSHGAGIHIEPYAVFSKKYKALSEVPDGASIAITNDASNQYRGLKLLADNGLLKDLTTDSTVVSLTPAQNPHGFKFIENQPEVIVQQLSDPKVDLAFVNGNFILTVVTVVLLGFAAYNGWQWYQREQASHDRDGRHRDAADQREARDPRQPRCERHLQHCEAGRSEPEHG